MSVKDKLEIGLKPDAPYREDNLPDFQKDDPDCQKAAEEGSSRSHEKAREDCAEGEQPAETIRHRSKEQKKTGS